MITKEHLEIYKKYKGDGDGFIRCATLQERAIMDYEHWSLIDDLIQNLNLIDNGLASDSFIESTRKKMKINCENEETIYFLKAISQTFTT